MAFRATDGVVGEVGTVDMATQKFFQFQARLKALNALTADEELVESYQKLGQPQWHGPNWRAADYRPEEGPVVIAIDPTHIISTAPTWEYNRPGVYLYALYKFDGHKLRIGVPVTVPKLSRDAIRDAQDAFKRFVASPPKPTSQQAWFQNWPSLKKKEIIQITKAVGIAVGVAALVVALAAAATATAAVAAFAAFVFALISMPDNTRPIA